MSQLSLTLPGAFQATLDGEPVTGFESDKVRALLVYLVLEADRPHRRDVLAELFWPERPQGVGLYGQADRILVEEAAIVPLAYGRRHLLVKAWVSRLPISAIGHWSWKGISIEPH